MAQWDRKLTLSSEGSEANPVTGSTFELPDIGFEAYFSVQIVASDVTGGTNPALDCEMEFSNDGVHWLKGSVVLGLAKVTANASGDHAFYAGSEVGASSKLVRGMSGFRYGRPWVDPAGDVVPESWAVEYHLRAVWDRRS